MSRVARDQCRFTVARLDILGNVISEWRCKKTVVARKRCRVHLPKAKQPKQGNFAATVAKRRARERHDKEARLGALVILRIRQKDARRAKRAVERFAARMTDLVEQAWDEKGVSPERRTQMVESAHEMLRERGMK